MKQRMAVIGYGNMGKAFLEGMLQKNVIAAGQVVVASPRMDRLTEVQKKWNVGITHQNTRAVSSADIVLLAVKPQQLRSVLQEIQHVLPSHTLVLSIAAGFSVLSITDALQRAHQPIVRVMPNLAATVGMSVSGWIANESVTVDHKKMVHAILQSVGTAYEVESEEMLDVVTAVTGSGPAYYYYFTEALVAGAMHLGMDKKTAETMVLQTFLGSAELLKASGKSPQTLREAVTSKGGTTEVAIGELKERKFAEILTEALKAARARAVALKT